MLKKSITLIGLSLILLQFGIGFVIAQKYISPTISIYPDIYYPLDEVLYLEGRANPDSTLQINFQKQGAKPLNFISRSDANGEWVLAEKINLEAGDWEARVRENLADGKLSEWSNPRIIKALVSGIVIGGIGIKFALLALIIIALLILSGFVFWYFSIRTKRLRAIIAQKELEEAHEEMRSGFSEIKQELLEKGQKKEHILRELERLERASEKEIKSIEKNID